MKKDNPVNRYLLRITQFVVAIPIFMLIAIPVYYFGLSLLLHGHEMQYFLKIGYGNQITGIDVYCNDVYMEKTPLLLSNEELERKVKKWKEPPRQERLQFQKRSLVNVEYHEPKYQRLKMVYSPRDPIADYKTMMDGIPGKKVHNFLMTDNDFKNLMNESPYWWRFEKNGCIAKLPLEPSSSGSSGNQWKTTIRFDLDVEFPSAKPHFDLMCEALRKNDYQPSDEWIAHFHQYIDLLFHHLYWKSLENPNYQLALNEIVRAEFGMKDFDEEESIRVIDEVMDRVEREKGFRIPSPESVAMELIGAKGAGHIAKRFVELIGVPSSSWGRSGSRYGGNAWCVYRREGRAVRSLPLEYAIEKFRPPELFDRLVYEYARVRKERWSRDYLRLIENYRKPEAERLVIDCLQDMDRHSSRYRRRDRESLIQNSLIYIDNPALESWIGNFVRETTGNSANFAIRQYIESRLANPETDMAELANWIFHWSPLKEREKRELIARLDTPDCYHFIKMLGDHNQSRRDDLIYQLEQHPNRHLDGYLIDSFEYYRSPQGPGYRNGNLMSAMVKCNTETMRDFLLKLWQDRNERRDILQGLNAVEAGNPVLKHWTDTLTKLKDDTLRELAVPVLAHTETPEAWNVLQEWIHSESENVRNAIDVEIKKREERQRLIEDLFEEKIKPDDLLPPAIPYVWNGEDYVEESSV